jgi:hypothetical protein
VEPISADFGAGRWRLLSPELFEVVGVSAARSPGLPWWRGGKVRRSSYCPSSASTTPACMVLCVVLLRRAQSRGWPACLRDLLPAWWHLSNLLCGGPSSKLLELDTWSPPSGLSPVVPWRPAATELRRIRVFERMCLVPRRRRLEDAGDWWWWRRRLGTWLLFQILFQVVFPNSRGKSRSASVGPSLPRSVVDGAERTRRAASLRWCRA